MDLQPSRRAASRCSEQGYVLLTLLLVIALLIIAAAAIVPSITFNIKRDREEEMIHRGVQYSRAIRAYYKKFGRYPTKLEDLESSNNLRFLRKRYKDPITGQDFKLLHFGDVKLSFSGGIGGGTINGATPAGQPTAFGSQPTQGTGASTVGGFLSSGSGPQSSSGAGSNTSTGGASGGATDQTGQTDSDSTGQGSGQGSAQNPGEHPGVTGQDQLAGATFGGGPIVGVVSSSKKDTIREFNHKKKYNEWQFIYDPALDRGGLLTTPNQPPIQGFGVTPQNLNGQSSGSGFGTGIGGQQPGTQNGPGSTVGGTPGSGTNSPPQ
jgi:type II secretory pathway pseudopilin PulG